MVWEWSSLESSFLQVRCWHKKLVAGWGVKLSNPSISTTHHVQYTIHLGWNNVACLVSEHIKQSNFKSIPSIKRFCPCTQFILSWFKVVSEWVTHIFFGQAASASMTTFGLSLGINNKYDVNTSSNKIHQCHCILREFNELKLHCSIH